MLRRALLCLACAVATPVVSAEEVRCPTNAELEAFSQSMLDIRVSEADRARLIALMNEATASGALEARNMVIAARLELGACEDDPDENGCEAERRLLAEARGVFQDLRAPLDEFDRILEGYLQRARDASPLCKPSILTYDHKTSLP